MTKPDVQALLDRRAQLKASLKPVASQSFRGKDEPYSEIDATNIPILEKIQEIEEQLDRLDEDYD